LLTEGSLFSTTDLDHDVPLEAFRVHHVGIGILDLITGRNVRGKLVLNSRITGTAFLARNRQNNNAKEEYESSHIYLLCVKINDRGSITKNFQLMALSTQPVHLEGSFGRATIKREMTIGGTLK
jgi:hypothetical protein